MKLFGSPPRERPGRNAAPLSRTPLARGVTVACAALVALVALVAAPAAHAADLQATPSNLASVFSGAQGGDTIHLASGSYGTFRGGLKPAPGVTLEPAGGANVSIGLSFNPASNITLRGIQNVTGAQIDGAQTNHISIVASSFSGQAVLRTNHLANASILLDHNKFVGFNKCSGCYEGRVEMPGTTSQPSGITISNNLFQSGCSDGIQNGSNGTVIAHNEFNNLVQGTCSNGAHVDSVQLYGSSNTQLHDNFFYHDEDGVVSFDCCQHGDHITNNLFVEIQQPANPIALYSHTNSVVSHNTLANRRIRVANKSGDPITTGTVIRDNIISQIARESGSISGDHDLCSLGCSGFGITGSPRFAGGSNPGHDIAGWALAAGSLGENGASDGTDIGADVSTVGMQGTPGPTGSGPTTPTPVTSATFTFAPTAPHGGEVVHFDGSGSTCAAAPCTYSWADDGPDGPGGTQWPLGSGRTLDFTFSGAGVKRVRLTVKDAQARSATIEHDVVVSR